MKPVFRWALIMVLLGLTPSAWAEHFGFDHEDESTGWTANIDNDLLFPVSRDQQYTGGIAFTLAGKRAAEYWYSLDPILTLINRWTGFSSLYENAPHYRLHSISYGVEAFTPANIDTKLPIYNDRPYANVVFLSNTQLDARMDEHVLYHSNFTIGVIGSRLGEDFQESIHRALGNRLPQGWRNQISDGGELTAKYTVTRQKVHYIAKPADGLTGEFRSVIGGSIGTTTEFGFGLGGRWGRITTPWWEFAPVFGDYINLGTPFASRPRTPVHELYVWGGMMARYRLYNALLEGQLRDSAVTYGSDQLERFITETALGVTWEPIKQWTLSLSMRMRSSEFRGNQGLNTDWGSLTLSHCY